MEDQIGLDMVDVECPMPEPFSASTGITVLLTWLFYLTFASRMIFAPLMPVIQEQLHWSHAQAGSFFLMQSIGLAVAPMFVGLFTASIRHRGTLFVSNSFDAAGAFPANMHTDGMTA